MKKSSTPAETAALRVSESFYNAAKHARKELGKVLTNNPSSFTDISINTDIIREEYEFQDDIRGFNKYKWT